MFPRPADSENIWSNPDDTPINTDTPSLPLSKAFLCVLLLFFAYSFSITLPSDNVSVIHGVPISAHQLLIYEMVCYGKKIEEGGKWMVKISNSKLSQWKNSWL